MNTLRLTHDWFDRALPSNVRVGDGSWVYSSFAFLHYRSRIATGVSLGAHSGIYDGTHFELGDQGSVSIGDYTAVVGSIFATHGQIIVGDYCFIAHEVYIADNAWAHPGSTTDRRSRIAIGDDVWIGARAIIIGSLSIGNGAVVGAGAVIDSDVPAFAIAAGNPWRIIGRTDRPRS